MVEGAVVNKGAEAVTIIYDGDCPVCNFYCKKVAIDKTGAELVLVNARDNEKLKPYESIIADKDLNKGFVVMIGETLFYADDAIHALALIASSDGCFNRFNKWMFSSSKRTRRWYPVLVRLRHLLLRLLRRSPI